MEANKKRKIKKPAIKRRTVKIPVNPASWVPSQRIPNSATSDNPDPEYIVWLLDTIKIEACISFDEISTRLGITPRALQYYCDPRQTRRAPYTVQFALECLVDSVGEKNILEDQEHAND